MVVCSNAVPARQCFPTPNSPYRMWPSASNRQSVISAVLTLIHKLQHQQQPYLRVHTGSRTLWPSKDFQWLSWLHTSVIPTILAYPCYRKICVTINALMIYTGAMYIKYGQLSIFWHITGWMEANWLYWEWWWIDFKVVCKYHSLRHTWFIFVSSCSSQLILKRILLKTPESL